MGERVDERTGLVLDHGNAKAIAKFCQDKAVPEIVTMVVEDQSTLSNLAGCYLALAELNPSAALAEAERAGRKAVAAEAERHYRASGYRDLTATEVRMLLAGTLAPAALEATDEP